MKFLVLCLGIFVSSFAMAGGGVSGAKVTTLMQDSNFVDYLFVDLDKEPTGRPACHTHPTFEYVIDLNTEVTGYGERLQSYILAAKMSGTIVTIVVTGTCNVNNIEILRRLQLN